MMDGNTVGVLVAVAGFVVAFVVAKWVAAAVRKRRQAREDTVAASQQTRQVRRAQARRNKA